MESTPEYMHLSTFNVDLDAVRRWCVARFHDLVKGRRWHLKLAELVYAARHSIRYRMEPQKPGAVPHRLWPNQDVRHVVQFQVLMKELEVCRKRLKRKNEAFRTQS